MKPLWSVSLRRLSLCLGALTDVIGNAEVMQMDNGAQRARIAVSEEGFWVSMYQSKDGAMTTITISR